MKISLICATLNRSIEVKNLLTSLSNQSLDKRLFEVIVVDQSDDEDTKNICDKSDLNIVYIKSKTKGLSFNRNLGISVSRYAILGFPDDDCIYYPDTLKNVRNEFLKKQVDTIIGKICSLDGSNVLKKWPAYTKPVSKYNYIFLCSSITIFTKNKNILFRENMGAGSKNGSSEDAKYLYDKLNANERIIYTPSIQVWHPDSKLTDMSNDKIIDYAKGNAMFYKDNQELSQFTLFFFGVINAIILSIIKLLVLDCKSSKKYFLSAKTRLLTYIYE